MKGYHMPVNGSTLVAAVAILVMLAMLYLLGMARHTTRRHKLDAISAEANQLRDLLCVWNNLYATTGGHDDPRARETREGLNKVEFVLASTTRLGSKFNLITASTTLADVRSTLEKEDYHVDPFAPRRGHRPRHSG